MKTKAEATVKHENNLKAISELLLNNIITAKDANKLRVQSLKQFNAFPNQYGVAKDTL